MWRIPRARESIPSSEEHPSVSIVIPARDEEHNLPALLESISSQTRTPYEVIVVDDDSTDATARVARDRGARVILPGRPPGNWTGKTWACWRGALAATGDVLLFLDADTRLKPDGLARILSEYRTQGRGVLSLYPYHVMHRPFERLSAFFNLVSMMSLGIATIAGRRLKPLGVYGACVLCSRKDYFACDGHRAVSGEVMEDVTLGKHFLKKGYPVRCLAGRGTIGFRMYPDGIKQMIEGWSKNFASGAKASNPLFVILIFAWITGALETMLIAGNAFIHHTDESVVHAFTAYVTYAVQVFWMLRRMGNFGFLTAMVFPIPLLFFLFVFLYSLLITFVVRRVRWRGRWISLRKTAASPSCR